MDKVGSFHFFLSYSAHQMFWEKVLLLIFTVGLPCDECAEKCLYNQNESRYQYNIMHTNVLSNILSKRKKMFNARIILWVAILWCKKFTNGVKTKNARVCRQSKRKIDQCLLANPRHWTFVNVLYEVNFGWTFLLPLTVALSRPFLLERI